MRTSDEIESATQSSTPPTSALLSHFRGGMDFVQRQPLWKRDTTKQFSRLAALIHALGLDWWFTRAKHSQLRFGRRHKDESRGAPVGWLHLRRDGIKVSWIAFGGLEGLDPTDLTSDIVDKVERATKDGGNWPAKLGPQVDRSGHWPDDFEPEDELDCEPPPIGINGSDHDPHGEISARNVIFYGPPGTGKTFHLQALLTKYTDSNGEIDSISWMQKLIGKVGWRPVIAAVLVDLGRSARAVEIKSHEFVAMKANLNRRSTNNMHSTVSNFLAAHTSPLNKLVQQESRREPFVFDKLADGRWSLLEDWQQLDPESAELVKQLTQGPTADAEPAKRYRVVTFHPSFGYEDFIRGIRPVVDPDSGESRFAMVDGVFKQICDEARANPGKRYALFIDEINRANIAKVFGELITLIEIDKRAQYDEAGRHIRGMEVQLPGAVDEGDLRGFGVPVNLDLYGTMNTADRSIALLDIALRRRFEFIERAPDYAVINKTLEGVHLGALLKRINDRLEYLLDRDHRVGHAYFIHLESLDDLRSCFEQKILPLLQEYFFDDASRVAIVLATTVGEGFLKPEEQSPDALFPASVALGRLQTRTRYAVTPKAGWTSAMFRGIYESGSAVSVDAEFDQDEVEPDSLDD